MTTDELRKGYQTFFTKTEAGKHLAAELVRIIVDCHEKAENDPDMSRDHTQRAKGVRLVKDHIDSVIAERKRPSK